MSDVADKNPDGWEVIGNMAPVGVSAPTSTSVFTTSNTTLTIEDEVTVDGNRLIPVLSVPDW